MDLDRTRNRDEIRSKFAQVLAEGARDTGIEPAIRKPQEVHIRDAEKREPAARFFFALIAEAGPARATVITYVNPAVAIVLGAIVLSEPVTLGMVIGFPLVIVGSVLGTSRARNNVQPELARAPDHGV